MRVPGTLRLLLAAALLLGEPAGARAQIPVDPLLEPRGPGDRPLSWLHHTRWLLGRDLPIGGVSSIVRTADGYLWIGSTDGLIRFDGVDFQVLDGESNPALASRAPGSTVPLIQDRSGTLWISRADGALVLYDRGVFEEAVPPSDDRVPADHAVQDGTGRIWLKAAARLYALDGRTFVDHPLPAPLTDVRLGRMTPDTADGLWVGTVDDGLWHVRGDTAVRVPFPVPADQAQVSAVIQTHDGRLWVVADGLLVRERNEWRRVALDGADIVPLRAVEAVDGSVWLATRSGLVREQSGRFERLGAPEGLSSDLTRSLILDGEGSAWITTDAGLDRLRASVFVTVGPSSGLPVATPLHVHADAGGGIWVLDYSSRASFLVDGGPVRREAGPVRATGIPGASIPVTASRKGGLWFQDLHADRVFLVREGRRTPVRPHPALAWTGVRAGVETPGGELWLGARAGGLGIVRDFSYTPIALPGVEGPPRVASMALDGYGRTWVSLADRPGLFALMDGGVAAGYDETTGVVADLDALTLERGDTLWAATPDHVLARVVGGRVSRVGVPGLAAALAAGSVTLLVGGDDLWVGSQGGIGRLPLAALHAAADGAGGPPEPQWFGEPDGLVLGRTTLLNSHAGLTAADGRLWFATPAGVAVVDPSQTPRNEVPPRPRVEEVLVAGRPGTVAEGSAIAPHPERIEVHFAAASLRAPERVRVEYRLDGADVGWVPAGQSRVATYTQLRPGRYVFRVRAWNEDGIPSASEATRSFRVQPVWYETRGFLVAAVLLLVGLCTAAVYLGQRARAHAAAVRMRAEFDAALGERARLARELHDTLLQGFTGVTLQLQALKGAIARSSPNEASALEDVLGTADATLREARQMVSHMRAPALDERGLGEALRSAVTTAVAGASVDLRFETRGSVRRLADEIEMAVLRVGREAVVNAVRHAEPTHIRVALEFGEERVCLRVEDDGRGAAGAEIERAGASGHWGIQGMRERARQAGGRLEIDSRLDGGTRVTLSLPGRSPEPRTQSESGRPT